METARTKWKFPELHNLEIGNRSGEEDEADILHDEIDVEKVGDSVGLATNTTISVNNTGNDQEDSDPTRATWMFRKFPELRNTEKGNRFGHNEDDTDDDEAS